MKTNRRATRLQHSLASAFAILALLLALTHAAKAGNNSRGDKDSSNLPTANSAAQDDTLRLQGEKAFHANCARCHAAPPKFSPRMAATIVRHMHVRATITSEEARLILHYMAE